MIDYSVNEINMPELKPKNLRENHFLSMKHPFRCSIVGSSGVGKTCLLRTLIEKLLDYDALYIICPSLDLQPLYVKLNQLSEKCDFIKCHTSISEFKLEDLDENLTNIVIFDDVMTEKKDQPLIEKAFSWGRHCSASIF
jgi:GTPase SAR1 family protein